VVTLCTTWHNIKKLSIFSSAPYESDNKREPSGLCDGNRLFSLWGLRGIVLHTIYTRINIRRVKISSFVASSIDLKRGKLLFLRLLNVGKKEINCMAASKSVIAQLLDCGGISWFCGKRSFGPVFTRSCHWILSSVSYDLFSYFSAMYTWD
jgi:hypothetical protein